MSSRIPRGCRRHTPSPIRVSSSPFPVEGIVLRLGQAAEKLCHLRGFRIRRRLSWLTGTSLSFRLLLGKRRHSANGRLCGASCTPLTEARVDGGETNRIGDRSEHSLRRQRWRHRPGCVEEILQRVVGAYSDLRHYPGCCGRALPVSVAGGFCGSAIYELRAKDGHTSGGAQHSGARHCGGIQQTLKERVLNSGLDSRLLSVKNLMLQRRCVTQRPAMDLCRLFKHLEWIQSLCYTRLIVAPGLFSDPLHGPCTRLQSFLGELRVVLMPCSITPK